MVSHIDAIVVGSGPNGLAAAVTMARAGLSVTVLERSATIGGGARTAELTLPGYRHDVCSAVHPMALASPFFQAFELQRRVEFLVPDISYAHAVSEARAVVAYRNIETTVDRLGQDGRAWRSLMKPIVDRIDGVTDFTGSQLLRFPQDPAAAIVFGLRVLEQGSRAHRLRFSEEDAPALLAGVNAHSIGRMPSLGTAGAGLLLGAHAHARGWPIPRGGSQSIIDSMVEDLLAHGGTIETGIEVTSRSDLPNSRATLFDVSARALDRILGDDLPHQYRRALSRFSYGDGVAKIDFALAEPVPWSSPLLREAPTIHLGGTWKQIAASEADVASGRHPDRPYVLVNQPSILDASRAPTGKHVLWAYTHVPHASDKDVSETIIRQIERSAPGFRDVILAQRHSTAIELEQYNPNYVGGDISSGAVTIGQLLKRPVVSADPWRTPLSGSYLCSSSTPPGTAVHGLSGFYAARSALRHEFGLDVPDLQPAGQQLRDQN